MNPSKKSIIAVIFCVASCAYAEPVGIGTGVDKAMADMRSNDYKETALAMGSGNDLHELKFWVVDGGVLIANYSKADRKISQLSYWFADNRGKSERQEFHFKVLEFDPFTGVMKIQTTIPQQ